MCHKSSSTWFCAAIYWYSSESQKSFCMLPNSLILLSHQREQLNRYLLLCIRYLLHVNKEVVRLYGTPHLSSRPIMHLWEKNHQLITCILRWDTTRTTIRIGVRGEYNKITLFICQIFSITLRMLESSPLSVKGGWSTKLCKHVMYNLTFHLFMDGI